MTRSPWFFPASALVSGAILSIRFDTPPTAPQSAGVVQDHTIVFTFSERQRVDIADAIGFDGGFGPSGDSEHVVMLDGNRLKGVRYVKALRTPWGTRFVFPLAPHAKTLSILFPAATTTLRQPVSGITRIYRFTLGCLIPRCVGRRGG
jgi:hypothetical protein